MESAEKEKEEIKPIFPNIKSTRKENALEMRSFLRKKHRGVWYLWEFYRSAYLPAGTTDFSAAISSFVRDIYLCQMFGKIDPKLTLRDGTSVYKMSLDQENTEKQRLDPKRFYERAEAVNPVDHEQSK